MGSIMTSFRYRAVGEGRSIGRLLLIVIIAAIAGLTTASAAEAESYSVERWNDCPASESSSFNSGGTDASGQLYVACGSSAILVYDPSGKRLPNISNPAGTVHDVAASPSGNYLYLARGNNPPARLVRSSGSNYSWDQSWQPEKYPYPDSGLVDDRSTPLGRFIATDGSGAIYLSDGAWVAHHVLEGSWNQTHTTVVKYSADGSYLTRFGVRNNGWALGDFSPGMHGLDVTQDGSRVFVADGNNNRVQRFDRQQGGSYVATAAIGSTELTDPDRSGGCGGASTFASPYDVSIDGSGFVYIANTSCKEVLKFNQSGSSLLSVINWGPNQFAAHGLVVSRNGHRVYVQAPGVLLRRDGSTENIDSGPDGPSQACLKARAALVKANKQIKKTQKSLKRTKSKKAYKRLKKKLTALRKAKASASREIRRLCP